MSQLDLNLLPLLRQEGQEPNTFPGIYMVTPPKRTARGREDDRLVLYFTEQGNSPLGGEQTAQILGKLAQSYFKASGSVTAALRTTADVMNQFLLDRNLKSANAGRQCVGVLALIVMRGQRLIVGMCGPLRGWLITPQSTEEWFDPQASGRGLGLARALSVRFFQTEYAANSYLILSAQPPVSWTVASLQSAHSQGIESFRRKLLSQAGDDVSAVVVQPQPGTGKIKLLRVRPPAQMVKGPDQAPTGQALEPDKGAGVGEVSEQAPEEQPAKKPSAGMDPVIVPPASVIHAKSQDSTSHQDFPIAAAAPEAEVLAEPAPVRAAPQPAPEAPTPVRAPITPGKPERKLAKDAGAVEVKKPKQAAPKPKKPPFDWTPVRRFFAPVGKAAGGLVGSIFGALARLLRSILPDESLFTLPGTTMAFIAVAIAVVMATTGIYVYWQRGRSAEYQKYYDLALQYASAALENEDPDEQRISWETTVDYLDKAEERLLTQDSQTLRANAVAELDHLDGIIRLDYQPALPGDFPSDIVITRILAAGADLFMLNGPGGDVIHAKMTGGGYEMDPNFDCGPNPLIGQIRDIAILPRASSDAPAVTLLALDSNNQLIRCVPGKDSVVHTPAAPQLGWIDPTAFTFDSGTLYILDAANRSVWAYPDMNTGAPPHLFFANDVPNSIASAVDLAVVNDRLYLLHQDSHIAECFYGDPEISPTRCDDPVLYDDDRPGRNDMPVILDARFNQIIYAPPPNPSLYMLDPIHQSIYHLSVQLAVQGQYRPLVKLADAEATAFTITPDHNLLLALGNKVYTAVLP
jgi:hypothetical protein